MAGTFPDSLGTLARITTGLVLELKNMVNAKNDSVNLNKLAGKINGKTHGKSS
jgi:hypothetical protein